LAPFSRELLNRLLIVNDRHARLVLADFEQHLNTHPSAPRPGQSRATTPATRPALTRQLCLVRRRDRIGGPLHEYQQVA
jgi:hypothetical protein